MSTGPWALGALSVSLRLAYDAASSMTPASVSMSLALTANVSIVVPATMRQRATRTSASIIPSLHPALVPA